MFAAIGWRKVEIIILNPSLHSCLYLRIVTDRFLRIRISKSDHFSDIYYKFYSASSRIGENLYISIYLILCIHMHIFKLRN